MMNQEMVYCFAQFSARSAPITVDLADAVEVIKIGTRTEPPSRLDRSEEYVRLKNARSII